MLVILTGTPAAGKSSVGERLARRFPKSAYFSVDTIRHFIVGGYRAPWEGAEAERQVELASDITKGIVQTYLDAGFVVIIDDIVGDRDVRAYIDRFRDVRAFLLLPSLEVLKRRDQRRSPPAQMGRRIDELYPLFAHRAHALLETLDTSEQSLEETVDEIYGRLVAAQMGQGGG